MVNHGSKCVKSMSVRILNGRVAGDNCGKFTRFPIYEKANEEPSVTDFVLSDNEFLSKIKYFSVSDLTRFSYHCSIMLSFQANFSVDNIDTNNSPQSFAPPKLIWKSHYKLPLENVFKSENCQSGLNLFCSQIYNNDQSGVDLFTEQLSNIITSATEAVIPIKPSNSIRKTKNLKKKWLDRSCSQMRSELNRLSKHLSAHPLNSSIKKAFIQCRKQYKKLL